MTLTLKDLAKEVWSHNWQEPILRAVAQGARRYREVRHALARGADHAPGDGQISKELRGLHELGLLDRRSSSGTAHNGWVLTTLGSDLLAFLDAMESQSAGSGVPLTANFVGRSGGFNGQRGLSMDEIQARADLIDTTNPHPARRYNYWLGGKDHFAVDRAAGDEVERIYPAVRTAARENRQFLQRAVRFMATDGGIDQYLDIGTGLPTADNTHEVAQLIKPASRVVYVDNDPMVMTHARALLTSTPEGRSRYIEEDLRNPELILGHPVVQSVLDFDRPIGLILVAVLHFIEQDAQARSIVRELVEALPSGSYVAASHSTTDTVSSEVQAAYMQLLAAGKHDTYSRTKEDFSTFLEGLQLVDPGVVLVSEWRSSVPGEQRAKPEDVAVYGAVGVKP